MKQNYSKILEYISQKGRTNVFIIIGFVGIALIVLSDLPKNKSVKTTQDSTSLTEYKYRIENELSDLLQEINGVGKVKVMLTLQSGTENIYAQQQKTQSNSQVNAEANSENSQTSFENQFVIIDNSGTDQPLIEKTLQPTIQGVVVVCSGADDITVVTAVTNAVAAVLDVPTHKIFVTKMR